MRRIALIGSAGSGKSTLAVELGRRLALPVHHLDRVFWRPGWSPMPKPQFIVAQQQMVQGDRWIIDGNYDSSLPIRLAAADTVIFLDLPTAVCLTGVLRRSIFNRQRQDLGEGCVEKPFTKDYGDFLLWVWNYRRDHRQRVLDLLADHGKGKTVHQLRSRAAVASFLKGHP